MRVVMLKTPWCPVCATMSKLYGDRVEAIDVVEQPEWLEKTSLLSVPICMIMDGDTKIAEKSGFMPLSVFDKWVADANSRS